MLKEYKSYLTKIDKNYVGDNRVADSKGLFYKDGISQLNEVPTTELMFNELFSTVEYEVPYLDLGVEKGVIRNRATKLDALVDGYRAFERKKTHILDNSGGYNEYVYKTLFGVLATQSFINPHTGKSTANISIMGDIEKLLLLPEKYEKNILFELWYDDVYQSDVLLDMVDLQINKYYVTEKDIVTYEDSIHPILTKCDIVHYKIIEKKLK